jgi:hypothetical protein
MSFDCDEVTLGWRFVLDDKGNVEDDRQLDSLGMQPPSLSILHMPSGIEMASVVTTRTQ